jgi:hypothetical protein
MHPKKEDSQLKEMIRGGSPWAMPVAPKEQAFRV